METTARLNPDAPLYNPVQRFHFPPAPITNTLHISPPPPPRPPPSFPLLPHLYYPHFIPIYPLLQKPSPPPPPPSPLSPYSFHKSIILEQPLPACRTSPTPPTVDSYADPSTLRADSAVKALNPVTSGPRFRPNGGKFRGGRGRKKEIQPEKGIYDGNSRERKSAGNIKFVWAKKTDSREIIPLREDEETTTIMIKNIPSKYTRGMLMQFLDKHCIKENERAKDLIFAGDEMVSAYDFVYLPIDFVSRLNKGYAFVNFTNPKSVWKFYDAFNGESWDFFNSPKRIDIVSAKIQGKEALVDHFERSHFCCDTDEYLPLKLDPARDGSGAPVSLRPVGNRFSPRRRLLH